MKFISFASTLTASVCVVLVLGCGGGQTSSTPKHDVPAISLNDQQIYLDAVNNVREEEHYCGDKYFKAANKVKWNESLYRAAYEHSHDMAESNFFGHKGSGTETDWTNQDLGLGRGSTFEERIEHNGFLNGHNIGENIEAGGDSAEEVVIDWIKSPDHCVNLMNPKFTKMGMSVVKRGGSEYGFYWTLDFGSQ